MKFQNKLLKLLLIIMVIENITILSLITIKLNKLYEEHNQIVKVISQEY